MVDTKQELKDQALSELLRWCKKVGADGLPIEEAALLLITMADHLVTEKLGDPTAEKMLNEYVRKRGEASSH